MTYSVTQDIARRVTATADTVAVGCVEAQLAATEARNYLVNLAPPAITDAYRRFTFSNQPDYLAYGRAKPESPKVPVWVWALGVAAALGLALTLNVVVALIAVSAVVVGTRVWRSTRATKQMQAAEQARLRFNPWPYRAERIGMPVVGDPHSIRVECQLLGLAVLLTEKIRHSPAWRNPLLDHHRVRINLDATLDDVSNRAHRIWKLRTTLPHPVIDPAQSAFSATVGSHLHEQLAAAEAAEQALRDHVAALATYLGELRPVERLLADLEMLDHANSMAHRELLSQLYRDSLSNQSDTARLAEHTDELRDLQASLDTQFHFLREQVERTQLLR